MTNIYITDAIASFGQMVWWASDKHDFKYSVRTHGLHLSGARRGSQVVSTKKGRKKLDKNFHCINKRQLITFKSSNSITCRLFSEVIGHRVGVRLMSLWQGNQRETMAFTGFKIGLRMQEDQKSLPQGSETWELRKLLFCSSPFGLHWSLSIVIKVLGSCPNPNRFPISLNWRQFQTKQEDLLDYKWDNRGKRRNKATQGKKPYLPRSLCWGRILRHCCGFQQNPEEGGVLDRQAV